MEIGGGSSGAQAGSATPTAVAYGVAAAAGSEAAVSREDHVHSNTNLAGALTATKSASTSKTSDTTLAFDPHLKVSLAANTVYAVEFLMCCNAHATPDMKVQLAVASVDGAAETAGSIRAVQQDNAANTYYMLAPNATATVVDTGGTVIVVQMRGFITTGASAGDAGIKWAQNSSSGEAATMLIHSSIIFTPIT